jgi:microcin C transport system substrate-binding protein
MCQTNAATGIALGYQPKYKENFSHFDYVNPQAPKGGNIALSSFGTYNSLNPFLLKSIPADGLGTLMFESLLVKSLDEPFSAYGLLASDVKLSDDKMSVIFKLNPKAKFNNNKRVTASDVKFSFDMLVSDNAHPQYQLYYKDVKQAVVLDQNKIKFEFKQKNQELHLILGDMPIFSPDWLGGKSFQEASNKKPITSGPYLIDKMVKGKFITYKKNPNYWGKNLNTRRGFFNFQHITYKYYKDLTIAQEAFKAGEFDFILENHSKRWAKSYQGDKFNNGIIVKETLPHKNNAGIQGFVFNLRKEIFKDKKTRRAIGFALDFQWSNKNLFYNQYKRCDSYFSNSPLKAPVMPDKKEIKLLQKYQDILPSEILTNPILQPPDTKPPSSLRKNLLFAKKLLKEAGWFYKNGVLQNKQGQKLRFSITLAQKGFERIVAPFVANLKKLGILVDYRTVDVSLYQKKQTNFNFDMLVKSYGQSLSPGNELRQYFHSQAADRKGSANIIGIKNPLVDNLIDEVIYAKNRESLITAVHALDRVLLNEFYIVPHWYIDHHRIAYKNKFDKPKTLPLYYQAESYFISTWYIK